MLSIQSFNIVYSGEFLGVKGGTIVERLHI